MRYDGVRQREGNEELVKALGGLAYEYREHLRGNGYADDVISERLTLTNTALAAAKVK